jgi:RNA polymerase primary sigma factor
MNMTAIVFDEDLRRLLDEAHRAPYLADGEDKRLGVIMQAGGAEGERARQRLIASHQRLVVSIAKQFLKSGKPLAELISDGKIGLVQAANKYDPKRAGFATVATWWVKAAIQNAAFAADDSADMPPSAKKKLYRIRKAERALAESGEEVTDAAIAARVKLPLVSVQRLRERAPIASLPTVSLDDTVGDGETTLGELLVDTRSADPHDSLQYDELKRALQAAMSELEPREQLVLSMRFGLVNDQDSTLAEVGGVCTISPERVRQIEVRALRKLKGGPHFRQLRDILRGL